MNFLDENLQNLSDYGCCEGVSVDTPINIYNRPGLTAIAYRTGTYAEFRETLLARISASQHPALTKLTRRQSDDFTIALLDAWAIIADVLTFYQERIANEFYLRTAAERLSVLELARLIGYELRPGVAANTVLAFTIEDTPGAFGQALNEALNVLPGVTPKIRPEPRPALFIEIGTKAQSIPGIEEKPQTYENIERIEARAEWNAIQARLRQSQTLTTEMTTLFLHGTATNLKKGDKLLIRTPVQSKLRTILGVKEEPDENLTRIDFVESPPPLAPNVLPDAPVGKVVDFPTKVDLTDEVVLQIIQKKWKEEDLSALAKIQDWSIDDLVTNISKHTAKVAIQKNSGVFAFRQRGALYGHNAPEWGSLPIALRIGEFDPSLAPILTKSIPKAQQFFATEANLATEVSEAISTIGFIPGIYKDHTLWADALFKIGIETINLDAVYSQIIPNSLIALVSPNDSEIFRVVDVSEETKSNLSITIKTTRLKISGNNIHKFSPRNATVYLQSEELVLAQAPIEDTVEGNSIILDRTYLGLKAGTKIILTGERSDLKGIIENELMTIKEVVIQSGFTVLIFEKSLAWTYVRNTVTLNANVASATHGETVQGIPGSNGEVLGSGDASQTFQRFQLRQPPLTYVSAATPNGSQTTLQVRVNDLLWQEVPFFYGHGPDERIYITRTDDAGNTTVLFGDGKTGARLMTGQENIKASYRRGIGLPGLVKANQISQLITRPLGVKGVTNPFAPSGAEDPEKLDQARRNAPLTVLTLGRIVSLQDYEDFARSFSGIEKALATWLWRNEKRQVLLTLAGAKGAEVKNDTDLHQNLLTALRKFGDPTVPLTLESYAPRFFRVSISIKVDPDFMTDKVLSEVESVLRENFSFESRTFGQPVHLSEIIAIIQAVKGVVAVDVDQFYPSDESPGLKPRLEAKIPRPGGDGILAAEILMLDPQTLDLKVMS